MCDSIVATKERTRSGHIIYGKNSDRSCNEPQCFVRIPAADHAPGSSVRCTYIEVEQVPHTYGMLLSKLSWTWGGEMGLNEHGVIIGNEAVFSKEVSSVPALLGMDLLRLGLERAASAREAVQVMGELLERYGQGGCGSFDRDFYYDNGFFVVDPTEAWYLETAGRFWAAKRVHGTYTIGNYMSMGTPEIMGSNVLTHAREMGYPVSEPFDFAAAYIDWERPNNNSGIIRRASNQRIMESFGEDVTHRNVWKSLCSHTTNHPFLYGDRSVCKHAINHTYDVSCTASMIAVMKPGDIALWGSTMSTACLTLLQPMWLDVYSSSQVYEYNEQHKGMERWVHYEEINRAMVDGRLDEKAYREERDALQERIFRMAEQTAPEDRQALCDEVAQLCSDFVEKWIQAAASRPSNPIGGEEMQAMWREKNAALGKDRRLVL